MLRLTGAKLLALTIALLAVSCASETSAAANRSGIRGKVVAGPTCPVETPESPCPDRPVPDAVVRATSGGRTKTTRSAESGAFRLRLDPGTYTVSATSDRVFGCDEQRVRVAKRRFTAITITCDTGIR